METSTVMGSKVKASVVQGGDLKEKRCWLVTPLVRREGSGPLWALGCFHEAGWEPGRSWSLEETGVPLPQCLPALFQSSRLGEVHLEPLQGQQLLYSVGLRS